LDQVRARKGLQLAEMLGSDRTMGPVCQVVKDLVKFQGLIKRIAQWLDQIMG
jgi:hypothetical protein